MTKPVQLKRADLLKNEFMLYMIGASSHQRSVDKAPPAVRKTKRGKVFAVPGFILHHTAKISEKQLQHFLRTNRKNLRYSLI